jgi:DNA-binding transcriptional regulator GbsR (MarR family)
MKELHKTFYTKWPALKLETPQNWMSVFEAVNFAIELVLKENKHQKIVLFFDEFPWMATQKSNLLQALDYYWNRFWSSIPNIILIICGSAASWITKNILNNKGGLHNRVTLRLPIEPFDLSETAEFITSKSIRYNHFQVLQLYMCIGGIPYYLKAIEKGLSAIQNVNRLCFQKRGTLLDEFNNLFSSLFKQSSVHETLIKFIASKREGVSREEILKSLKFTGGRLTTRLKELEEAGFIIRYTTSGRTYGHYYKVIDEYTLFYLQWIAPDAIERIDREIDAQYWEDIANTPAWNTWAGYAFELICFKHLTNIKKALNIPAGAIAKVWRHISKKETDIAGAQIDLLFDRPDGIITICEIKYSNAPYTIDKIYSANLLNKIATYKKITKTTKQIFISMITTFGLKETMYSEELVNSSMTLEDFFKSP